MSYELEAHAEGHGRAYQQGLGQQFHVEYGYFGNREILPPQIFQLPRWPLVIESDPLELGVHRAAVVQGNAVPQYVQRDIDTELIDALRRCATDGGIVLLVGDSTAGKTRSLYEASVRVIPNHRLVVPDDKGELRAALAHVVSSAEPMVLWLDNVERFIGSDGLTPRIAAYLRHSGVISVATIRAEQYRQLGGLITPHATGSREHDQIVLAESVLRQAETILLDRRWSAGEAERAREVDDTRIRDAVEYAAAYGVAEYLAAGPMLYRDWQLAWSAGANPRGAALVAAAVDCHRAGLRTPLPVELIRRTHEYYLDNAGGSLLRPESFEEGLAWATLRRSGIASLLLPGKRTNHFSAFDYLTDTVMRSENRDSVPRVTWDAIIEFAGDDVSERNQIALAASVEGNSELAEAVWQDLAADGFGGAAHNLGRHLLRAGQEIEGQEWLQKAFDLGYVRAATELGHLLLDRNDVAGAEEWFMRAAEKEDPHGMFHAAIANQSRGRLQEAEDWYRRALEGNERSASKGLGHLLLQSGRLHEAEHYLRSAAEDGDVSSLVSLGIVLSDLDRDSEAESIWKDAAEKGVSEGAANLALFYARRGRKRQAEDWFRRAIDAGFKGSMRQFGAFLAKQRRWREAERWLREAVDGGDTKAYRNLGLILWELHLMDEAVAWLSKAVESGDEGSVASLAQALDESDRRDEAIEYWQRLADRGDDDATYALAKAHLDKGDVERAIELFQIASDRGHEAASCELARTYEESDPNYVLLLRKSLEGGHAHAACLLGTHSHSKGDFDAAKRYWERAYDGGHFHVAGYLSLLLASQGMGREAALWLRRANQLQAAAQRPRPMRRGRKRR